MPIYVVLMLSPFMLMMMSHRLLLLADAYDDVMLKCVYICVRLCLYTARVYVMFMYMYPVNCVRRV